MKASCIHCLHSERYGWQQVIFTSDCEGCHANAIAQLPDPKPVDPQSCAASATDIVS